MLSADRCRRPLQRDMSWLSCDIGSMGWLQRLIGRTRRFEDFYPILLHPVGMCVES